MRSPADGGQGRLAGLGRAEASDGLRGLARVAAADSSLSRERGTQWLHGCGHTHEENDGHHLQ